MKAKEALATGVTAPPDDWHARASLGLFTKLRNREVVAECERVEGFLQDKALRAKVEEVAKAGVRAHARVFYGRPSPGSDLVQAPAKALKLQKVFGNRNPVRLEVCSGHGDWIVGHAKETPDVNWIALEMRPDRVHLIWTKMVCQGLDNMMVLGGTAHEMMQWHLRDASIEEVFVNYPDPPVWHGSRMRLIDEAFLQEAHRVLAPGGHLVIVTDDAAYAKIIIRQLGRVATLFKSAVAPRLYQDAVPEGYGSSYFDRMWSNGNRTDRYYIRHVRLDK